MSRWWVYVCVCACVCVWERDVQLQPIMKPIFGARLSISAVFRGKAAVKRKQQIYEPLHLMFTAAIFVLGALLHAADTHIHHAVVIMSWSSSSLRHTMMIQPALPHRYNNVKGQAVTFIFQRTLLKLREQIELQ